MDVYKYYGKTLMHIMLTTLVLSCGREEEPGRLVVRLTDSPGDYEAVNIDIQDVQVNSHANSEQGWVSLPNINKGIYNLLDLTNKTESVLTRTEYPAGRINQIRLVLGDSNSVIIAGTKYPLQAPGAKQSGLKLQLRATLTKGITYAILLDFDAAKSVVKTGNGEYILKPVLKVVSEAVDGAVSGEVIPSELNVAVYALAGSDTVSTSYAPAGTSEFYLGGLSSGTYTIVFDPGNSSVYDAITLENVTVTLNAVTETGVTEMKTE